MMYNRPKSRYIIYILDSLCQKVGTLPSPKPKLKNEGNPSYFILHPCSSPLECIVEPPEVRGVQCRVQLPDPGRGPECSPRCLLLLLSWPIMGAWGLGIGQTCTNCCKERWLPHSELLNTCSQTAHDVGRRARANILETLIYLTLHCNKCLDLDLQSTQNNDLEPNNEGI